jgi:hypothetical protein
MGTRGTEFIVVITPNAMQIQVVSGKVVVTANSGQVVTMSTPGPIALVDSQGNAQGPARLDHPLVNFANLGPSVARVLRLPRLSLA